MAEARSRREFPPRMRPRMKPDGNGIDRPDGPPTSLAEQALMDSDSQDLPETGHNPPDNPGVRDGGAARPEGDQVRSRRDQDEEDFQGFDAEINNRYEEIKRGSTHISELQQMTMPQLLKIAKDEGLSDYTG